MRIVGRPKLDKNIKLTQRINIGLTNKEYAAVEKISKSLDLTIQDYCRMKILTEVPLVA